MQFDTYANEAPLREVGALARDAADLGLSTMWFAESAHNPFLPSAVASEAAPALGVGTSIAIAFARSPMVTAQLAWDLAVQTDGKVVHAVTSAAD